MKTPYVHIIAECGQHGQFILDRKPRKEIVMSSGSIQSPYYSAVVCPTCRMWGKITEQIIVGGPQ